MNQDAAKILYGRQRELARAIGWARFCCHLFIPRLDRLGNVSVGAYDRSVSQQGVDV
jgi:hypothetical protein